MDFIEKNKKLILVLLAVLNVFVFSQLFVGEAGDKLRFYFLNVGEGDSELVILPGGIKVLIDGGPANGSVLAELDKILKPTDRYIDLVVMSHPQLDHFGGLIEVLDRYRVGAFLTSGREGTTSAFVDFKRRLDKRGIHSIVVRAGDKIKHGLSLFNILSPTEELLVSKELNDSSIVMHLASKNITALFTGDIGFNVERRLLNILASEVDILKVAHHGSKYSSSADFLKVLKPKIAAIETGRNHYGHPAAETLKRLSAAGAEIYRTDKDGTIEILIDGESAKIFKL